MQLFKLVTFGIFWKLGSTSDDFMVMGVAVFNTTVAGKQDIYNNSNALASTAIEDSLQFAQMNPLDNGGCAAIELPLSPTGECLPNPSLPSWCLPVFKQLNGIDLLCRRPHSSFYDCMSLCVLTQGLSLSLTNLTPSGRGGIHAVYCIEQQASVHGDDVQEYDQPPLSQL
mmetsp:Transcript_17450/g.41733  ORF Transcript_17450/g.41733 Transcript_17450/m.41733 type:complete len:170 (-) Transcript_17450:752-1261(-)